MAKDPRPGQVKSRLAADIGKIAACTWTRHRLATLARSLCDPRWQMILAVAPDRATSSRLFPPLPRTTQGKGNLGDRMARQMRTQPRGLVLVIGTDIPGITAPLIASAFRMLRRHGAVIGPSLDGGFWAIGYDTRRPMPPRLFHGVRWSTRHALSDTLATLPKPAFLPKLLDVDTAEDLTRLSA